MSAAGDVTLNIPANTDAQPLVKTSIYTIDKGMRIKRVAEVTLIVLGSVLAAAAVAAATLAILGATVVPVIPMLPLAIVAAATGSVALGILALKLWQVITPHLPESLRHVANCIETIVTETLGVVALGVLFPINSTWFDPKKKEDCDPTQTPVLFIHGFCGSSNNWEYHRHRLGANGHKNLFTINLGSPTHSIQKYSDLVAEKVSKIKELTGRQDLIIIGHSMGGLVAKDYMYNHKDKDQVKVKQVISLGTPHNGTKMSVIAKFLKPAKQMEYKSLFVTDLQTKAASDKECEFHAVGTKTDAVVIPNISQRHVKGECDSEIDKPSQTKVLEKTGHVGFLFSDDSADYILQQVKTCKESNFKTSSV